MIVVGAGLAAGLAADAILVLTVSDDAGPTYEASATLYVLPGGDNRTEGLALLAKSSFIIQAAAADAGIGLGVGDLKEILSVEADDRSSTVRIVARARDEKVVRIAGFAARQIIEVQREAFNRTADEPKPARDPNQARDKARLRALLAKQRRLNNRIGQAENVIARIRREYLGRITVTTSEAELDRLSLLMSTEIALAEQAVQRLKDAKDDLQVPLLSLSSEGEEVPTPTEQPAPAFVRILDETAAEAQNPPGEGGFPSFRSIVAGLLLGLAAGVGYVACSERFQPTVYTASEVGRTTGWPVLATFVQGKYRADREDDSEMRVAALALGRSPTNEQTDNVLVSGTDGESATSVADSLREVFVSLGQTNIKVEQVESLIDSFDAATAAMRADRNVVTVHVGHTRVSELRKLATLSRHLGVDPVYAILVTDDPVMRSIISAGG